MNAAYIPLGVLLTIPLIPEFIFVQRSPPPPIQPFLLDLSRLSLYLTESMKVKSMLNSYHFWILEEGGANVNVLCYVRYRMYRPPIAIRHDQEFNLDYARLRIG